MVGEDWLALPDDGAAEKNPDSYGWETRTTQQVIREREAAEAVVEEVTKNLPATIAAPALPTPPIDAGTRAAMLDQAWKKLDKRQKSFLTLLRENKFNERATIRLLSLTSEKISRTTVRRWHESVHYVFVLQVMKTVDAGASIDRERLLLRAEEIAEESLAPTPILYQGAPTGFYENHKDTALRANEQLMKAAGMLKGDEKTTRVTVRVVNLAGPEEDNVIDATAEVAE